MRVLFLSKDDLDNHPEVDFNEIAQEYQHKTDSYVIPTVMAEELCSKELFCYCSNGVLVTRSPTKVYRITWTVAQWMIKEILVE